MSSVHPPTILFDGVCNVCNASVHFVLDRDRGRFLFGSLQSSEAQDLLSVTGIADHGLTSIVLIEGGKAYTESDAVLQIASQLPGPVRLLAAFRVIPAWIRDPVYRWVARNRYRWFGRRDTCRLPTPELAARFIETATG